MKPSTIRVLVTDQDGTLLDQHNIELSAVMARLKRDPRAILEAADEAKDMIHDEIMAALRRRAGK